MTLPTIATYVPFSDWIYIPADWSAPYYLWHLVVCIPQKVSVKYSDSAVLSYVVLALTDALLTLAIYGVNFLGVF